MEDADYNSEGVIWGGTTEITKPCHQTDQTRIAAGGNITAVFYETFLDNPPPNSFSITIAHELGHQFGLDHGTIYTDTDGDGCDETDTLVRDPAISSSEFSNWGLMSAGGLSTTATMFIINDTQINLIRSRVNSPGQ